MSFLLLLLSQMAFAQLSPEVAPRFFPTQTQSFELAIPQQAQNDLPNIVLIGYWPPTNLMVHDFNPKNPDWIGEDWEGLGFNIIAFSPEFKDGSSHGSGDFEVDYQDTSSDFWRLIPPLDPVAVLSFGRAKANYDWEIEMLTRNLSTWRNDYRIPYRPDTSPPDPDFERDAARLSPYPGALVAENISSQIPHLNAFTDDSGAGEFLCEYLGFHLSWYQSLFPDRVKYGVHTHIGSKSELSDLKKALKIKLRTLISEMEK